MQKPAPVAPPTVVPPQEPPTPVTPVTATVPPAPVPPAPVVPVPAELLPPVATVPTEPIAGTPQAKTITIDDDETVLVDKEGNSVRFADAKAFGYRKSNYDRTMRELSDQKKQLTEAAGQLNKDATDPFVADYINFKRTHPELSENEVRAAIGRLYGISTPQNQPPAAPVDLGPPKLPDGVVSGDPEHDKWLVESMAYFSNKAAETAVKPILESNAAQQREREALAKNVAASNVTLESNKEILRQYPHFVDFDVDALPTEDRNEFFNRIREVAQNSYGVAFTDEAMRGYDPERFLDKYELIISKAWPQGTRPGKTTTSGLSPADIVSQHLVSGLGLVPPAQIKPPLSPPVPQSLNQTPPKSGKPANGRRDPAKMDRLLHGEKTT